MRSRLLPVVLSCALLGPLAALAEDAATTPATEKTETANTAKPEKPKAKVICRAPTGSILAPRNKDCKTSDSSKSYSPDDLRKSRDFDPASKATGMGR